MNNRIYINFVGLNYNLNNIFNLLKETNSILKLLKATAYLNDSNYL